MGTIASFLSALARRTRPDRAAEWDPVGLQLGDPARTVDRVAVCHEITERIVGAALESRPDLVVSYHPLLFRPTGRIVAGRSPEGRAYRLVGNDVAVAVTHTDFDAAPGGTADALAEELALGDVRSFGPIVGKEQVKVVTFVPEEVVDDLVTALSEAGAGRIGNYDACSFRVAGYGSFMAGEGAAPAVGRAGEMNVEREIRVEMLAPKSREAAVIAALGAAHPYEEPAFDVYDVRSNHGLIGRIGRWAGTLDDLVRRVDERLSSPGLRVAGDLRASPGRVAVVPGSGGSFVEAARRGGAGALVTGDVDHHRAVAALDAGLTIVDPGHAATEIPGMRRLVEAVGELGVEVQALMDDGAGPWTRLD